MVDSPPSKPNFWTTLQGVITGVAALLTALAALLGAFGAFSKEHPAPANSTAGTGGQTVRSHDGPDKSVPPVPKAGAVADRQTPQQQELPKSAPLKTPPNPDQIVIGVSPKAAGAFPAISANGGLESKDASEFRKAEIDVRIVLSKDASTSALFDMLLSKGPDKADVILTALDNLTDILAETNYQAAKFRVFFLTSWSRGNLTLVADTSEIRELDGQQIATTHSGRYFVLKVSDLAGIAMHPLFTGDTPASVSKAYLESRQTRGAALWHPDIKDALEKEKYPLFSTAAASNLVAGVLIAKDTLFLKQKAKKLPDLLRIWMRTARALDGGPADNDVKVIADSVGLDVSDVRKRLKLAKLAQFADNRAFFRLDSAELQKRNIGPTFDFLFEDQKKVLDVHPNPSAVAAEVGPLQQLMLRRDEDYKHESIVEKPFGKFPQLGRTLLHVSTTDPSFLGRNGARTVRGDISFQEGTAKLTRQGKTTLDSFLRRYAGILMNTFIRVEGNTDSSGDPDKNQQLSERRAQAIVNYLVGDRYRMDPKRLFARGNGATKPLPDPRLRGDSPAHRRVEFFIIENPDVEY